MERVDELIMLCAEDKSALETLYRMFKKDVFALSMSIVRDFHLSEDCVVEAFLRLTNAAKHYRALGKGKFFILKITSNTAHEIYRKNKVNCELDEAALTGKGEFVDSSDNKMLVESLLFRLEAKQREIITLRYYIGLTFKEIAGVIKMGEGGVKWHCSNAIEKMRKVLAKEGMEFDF